MDSFKIQNKWTPCVQDYFNITENLKSTFFDTHPLFTYKLKPNPYRVGHGTNLTIFYKFWLHPMISIFPLKRSEKPVLDNLYIFSS